MFLTVLGYTALGIVSALVLVGVYTLVLAVKAAIRQTEQKAERGLRTSLESRLALLEQEVVWLKDQA